MSIKKETIERTMKLSRLKFNEEEFKQFEKELDKIIDMVEQLDELDTSGVEGTYHGIGIDTILREDVPKKDAAREALLDNAKTTKDGLIQVPNLVSDGEGEA